MSQNGDSIRLADVTPEIRAAVEALELRPDQEELVASNAESLEEADEDPCARPRAIYAGDRLVGFLMYDTPDEGVVTIYRFMIDRREQGKGYGRGALERALDEIRTTPGAHEISICYMPQNVAARDLYSGAGFTERGIDEDGEVVATLPIARRNVR